MYETVYGVGIVFLIVIGFFTLFGSLMGDKVIEKKEWKMKSVVIIVGLAMFAIGGGLWEGIFPFFPPPGLYSRVANFDKRILIKGNGDWKKEVVVPKKKVEVKFTTDEKKVGKFEYDFGWVKWEPATENVKRALAIRKGNVYYLSKKGKVKKMKFDFYKKYKK